ncbi:MAG: hypothetical protein PVF74_10150 [Anaerolineales bacterium]|jgi:hypothetical protein
MKKISVVIVFMLVALLFVGVLSVQAAEDDKPDLTYLTMINRTNGPVSVQMSGDAYYYLTVGAGETKTFHVEKGMYDRNTFACGLYATGGTLNMSSRVRLVFPDCIKGAANQGEPSMEKVSLFDTPYGKHYRYQDP